MKLRKLKFRNIATLIIALAMFLQCQKSTTSKDMKITKSVYGTTKNGEHINSFRLSNENNVEVEIIEYGAIIAGIKTPDKKGHIDDITLGNDDLENWENDSYYFGATIGRVANRTGGASFVLNGEVYNLAPNTLPDFGKNHLHGGVVPFNKVVWKGKEFQNDREVGVVLEYTSKDMEEGYPGNLIC